jgi:hypothetical protein
MPRYFFNLTNGTTIRDTEGEQCADLDAAKTLARRSARDLARNKRRTEINSFYVCVTDEHGNEVFRTPLAHE